MGTDPPDPPRGHPDGLTAATGTAATVLGMSDGSAPATASSEATFDRKLAVLLSMAMFVLVVDTSLMNVSISAVVRDLGTTVSGVQGAIALEALVSAAFILIGSKIGDLIGRKRAYVLGLGGYFVGAISMTLAQSLVPIIIFWAIIGGIGAALLLPAMQSLVHGNFEGTAQKKVYATIGAAAAIAAAVGPLLGGFITTFLSWRVGFALEACVIAVVLIGVRRIRDVPYTGPRQVDVVGAIASAVGMGGLVLGILLWQEGGESVGAVIAIGVAGLAGLAWWLLRRERQHKPMLLDPSLMRSKVFRLGFSGQMLQQIALGGSMIVLPIFLQMVLGYNALETGITIAPLSLTMFAVAIIMGKRAGRRRTSTVIRAGFAGVTIGLALLLPVIPRATSGWWFAIPLFIAGLGWGLVVSQLNSYTLAPIDEERVSEAAGVNSAAGSFGLSFGLAFAGAIMLATLSFSFTAAANDSTVLSAPQKDQVSTVLEHDAQLMSDEQLTELLADEPPDVSAEILRINDDVRPLALQIGLLVPVLAALVGFVQATRMTREPDPTPSEAAEGLLIG
jgi:MFS family permease